MRTGFASDIKIYDSPVCSYESERKRRHRWMRGDVQSLILARKQIRDKHGDFRRSPLNYVQKERLLNNVYDIIFDIFRLPFFFLSFFCGGAFGFILFLLSIADYLFEFANAALLSTKVPYRKYLSGAPNYYNAFIVSLYLNFGSIPDRFCSSADALVRSVWRLTFSKKKLLEWSPSNSCEVKTGSNVTPFCFTFKSNVIIGILSIIASVISHSLFSSFVLLLSAAIWLTLPLFVNRLEKNKVSKRNAIKKESAEDLIEHAKRMWNYFADNVTDETNHLPPDNVTVVPYRKTAERTSPTNIGMYLLSIVNAFDFGFLGSEELYNKLKKTIQTIKELEKWKGHLYNWYDTKTCEVLSPRYVSAVDSGNLIVSLMTVKSAISRFSKPFDDLIVDLESLIENADFYDLYNKNRDLFYIGYNETAEKFDKNVYDLYMSEMLSTSFCSVAKGFVPANHLSKLRKPLNEELKTSPMLSWSGTAFEYFMPSIFLPRSDRTERGEALLAAYNCQKCKRLTYNDISVFGKSESGYYDFDDSLNYRYKAHGVKNIAVSSDSYADNVFAPYSLYLMLGYEEDVVETLRSLCSTELNGIYGLYEAVDFSKKRVGKGYGIVSQYMSHHIGMSIASIANYCLDDINVKRFTSDPKIASALPYIYNKIEICRQKVETEAFEPSETENFEVSGGAKYSNTDIAIISNSITKVIADKNGNVQIYNGKDSVIKNESKSVSSLAVYFKVDKEKYNCVVGNGKYSFIFDGCTATYLNEYNINSREFKTEVSITVDPEKTDVYLKIKASGDIQCGEFLVFFIPLLNDEKAYESSPSYSDIFLTSDFEEDGSVTFIRGNGEKSLNVSISSGVSKWFTKAHEVFPFMYTEKDIKDLFENDNSEKKSGAVVHPLCAFVTEAKNNVETEIKLSLRSDKSIKRSFEEVKSKAQKHFKLMSSLASADQKVLDLSLHMVRKIILEKSVITKIESDITPRYKHDIFWRYGISGDLPLVLNVLGDISHENLKNEITTFLKAKRFLFLNGIRFDLLFVNENEGYNEEGSKILHSEIKRCGCEMLFNKDNGIFIIKNSSLTENDKAVITAAADFIIDHTDENIKKYKKVETESSSAIVKYAVDKNQNCEINNSLVRITNGMSPSPWCMIYANYTFGTLLTNRSAGFTWYHNSALANVSKRHLDPIKGTPGETLILHYKGADYDILSFAETAEYMHGCAVYKCRINNLQCTVSVGIDPKLPLKLYHLLFDEYKSEEYFVSLNVKPAAKCILTDDELSLLNEHGTRLKLLSVGDQKTENLKIYSNSISLKTNILNGSCAFILASNKKARNEKLFAHVKSKFRTDNDVLTAFNEYEKQKLKILSDRVYRGALTFIEKQLAFSAYQAIYFRILARCGYSQTGGAYGFRDQLQDSLLALYLDPEITKLQILRSCQRQYENGRCQHWWHPYVGGLKSRCSDDYMWLLYVTSEYILATLDKSILDYKISFLSSPELSEDEEDRYENPGATTEKYTVKEHLLRAYEASKERGEHGLPLMLSGDWNDGMNKVGDKGRGESVWLDFFFAVTYRKTAEALLFADRNNAPIAEEMLLLADNTLKAAEGAWDGGWYLRAYDDDGKVLGGKNSPECKIDIIPQAFSVFAKADPKRSRIAMKNAEVLLYNKKHGIFRLFAPSFDKISDYGYICRYPAGIRENGGQYTHAAIFAAMAYFEIGEEYTGLEILRSLSPNDIYESGRCKRFSSEPYLLAADIYYGDGITGKSGWSGYTGSAAWYYRAVMKYVLGIVPEFGKFKITPKRFNSENYTVNLTYKGKKILFDFVFDGSKADTEGYDLIFLTEYEKSVYVTPENRDLKILIKVTN